MIIRYENEEWKSLDFMGYTDYIISNYGRVKSRRGSGKKKDFRILTGGSYGNGYKKYSLQNNDGKRLYLAHRLVAMAFIPNPDNLPVVNHKDEDRLNNHVSNLEWCTQKYNIEYSRTTNVFSDMARKNRKPVVVYNKDGSIFRYYISLHDCLKNNANFDARCIHRCFTEKVKSHRNYIFKYYETLTDDEKIEVELFKATLELN